MSDLIEGQIQYVQGSGKKPYELQLKGGVYSCSCMAWRNQSIPINKRTCKHLKMVRGDAAEQVRVSGTFHQAGVTSGRIQTAVPNQTKPPRTDPDYEFTPQEDGRIPIMTSDEYVAAQRQALTLLAEGSFRDKESVLADAELKAGRKLRPDEKTKLFGPPVLLAHPFEDAEGVDPTGWWMSEKLDGVRAYWDGKQFLSRQGNVFHAPDWFKAGLPDHPLDGELWTDRRSFQQTISIVKSIDAGERWKAIKYMVFDLPHLTTHFEHRYEQLDNLMLASTSKVLKMVQQRSCTSLNDLKQELERVVKLGAEGLMIRKPKSMYEAGRSWSILKVKPWRDSEATVVGYEAGKGRHKGRTGGLIVRLDVPFTDPRLKRGAEFNIGTGLSDEDRRNPPAIGKVVTFRYMDTTDAGVPKGASFVSVRDYE